MRKIIRFPAESGAIYKSMRNNQFDPKSIEKMRWFTMRSEINPPFEGTLYPPGGYRVPSVRKRQGRGRAMPKRKIPGSHSFLPWLDASLFSRTTLSMHFPIDLSSGSVRDKMKMNPEKRIFCLHIIVGSVISILLLHPITKAVYWFEFREEFQSKMTFWGFLLERLQSHFLVEMIPMSVVFGFIGGIVGLLFGIYHLKLTSQNRAVQQLERELGKDLPSLIAAGETDQAEFKSSVRWDIRQAKVNKALEMVIAKTIAGFMNHRGGNLLIGVDDDGDILGLENDYKTLKHKNRDGFEQLIMDIVKTRLGGDKCSFIHTVFSSFEEKGDVCRVLVEPSSEPVYCNDSNVAKYFVRTGNLTRELDAQEIVSHVRSKAKKGE